MGLVVERMKQEVEWDNVPGEFECAIMGELMQDPVILPSGNRCDRKNIERHILSTPNDPFNRQPLTEDMLKPDLELKAQIDNWKNEQMKKSYRWCSEGGFLTGVCTGTFCNHSKNLLVEE